MSDSKSTSNEVVIGHQFSAYYKIPLEKFFQFALSVDCIILGYHGDSLKLLVIERGTAPHLGKLALPGDLVYPNEDMDVAASRVLTELTGLKNVYMTQSKSYGQVDRHPVGRVITSGYFALVSVDKYQPLARSWADNVSWVDVDTIPKLAFDHNQIVNDALSTLREKVRYKPIGFNLLPKYFTLGDMQSLYEAILNTTFDKANFRKKILSMNLLVNSNRFETKVSHRPARLFSFDQNNYETLLNKGFSFEL